MRRRVLAVGWWIALVALATAAAPLPPSTNPHSIDQRATGGPSSFATPAITIPNVEAELAQVASYLTELDTLKQSSSSSSDSQTQQAQSPQPQQQQPQSLDTDVAPTSEMIDREILGVRDYQAYLQNLLTRLQSGEKIDPTSSAFKAAAAGAPSVGDLIEVEVDNANFDSSQDGAQDQPPTLAQVEQEEQNVQRYLKFLDQLRLKINAGQKSTEAVPLPTLAELVDEEKATRSYLAELHTLKQQLQQTTPMPSVGQPVISAPHLAQPSNLIPSQGPIRVVLNPAGQVVDQYGQIVTNNQAGDQWQLQQMMQQQQQQQQAYLAQAQAQAHAQYHTHF